MTKVERREEIKGKILRIFKLVQDTPSSYPEGIGKDSIKRILLLQDASLKISINTVKKRVDEFVRLGIIECVNPEALTNLKFRLTEV